MSAPRKDAAAGARATPAWPYALLVLAWLAGTALMIRTHAGAWQAAQGRGAAGAAEMALLALVSAAESVALFYLLGFLGKSAAYLVAGGQAPPPGAERTPPAVAVLYLTAGDFDPAAVDSLLGLEWDGPKRFVLHDDGADEKARAAMSAFVEAHPRRAAWEVEVLHRPARRGGKAGAVNWVVERLDPRWELLLLCDSDSIAVTRDAVARAAGEFRDPDVAVVQFRNVGHASAEEPEFHRRIAQAIDVFDAFATPQSRWGYLPFFGHNALLRVETLRRLGGLTPGFFSDDLDYSVRLTLAGRRVRYRPDLVFAERHPADWTSFRRRARKWAFGCMQVVRARALAVLFGPGVPFAHRVGLLEFMGFYPAQALLLAGLLTAHLVLPWLAPQPAATPELTASGALVVAALLAPTLAWAIRARRLAGWPALAWACVLVYGGSILSTVRGVIDGLSARERPWIPTNLAHARAVIPGSAWAEAALGLALVAVPWLAGSPALAFPATYLFVATLLFAPLTYAAYRDPAAGADASRARRRPDPAPRAAAVAALAAVAMLSAASGAAASDRAPRLRAAGTRLTLDGAPFQVRGVHYSPWLPGTGPGGGSAFPGPKVVDRDLDAIRSLGANTVLLHDAPGWVIRHAHQRGLVSIYAFHVMWNDTSRAAFERQVDPLLAAVDSLRGEPGLVLWVLGNEVPTWVVDRLGAATVQDRLRELAARVREHDPDHLLGHANWPPTRGLDLSFLDVACFNLYPAWPYEVAVRGFGPYLRDVLTPLAHGRPLLLTEFGINSLEAGESRQAEVLADCWRDIAGSAAAGGVVFEWADEWWKNYDNPRTGGDYWQRVYAPDDAARHDQDPEEYYGIVHGDRSAKPALAAVRSMWGARPQARSPLPWIVLAALAVATALAFGLAPFRRRARRGARGVVPAAAILLVAGLLAGREARAGLPTFADTLTGTQADSQFGWAVGRAGDLLGNGRDVVAVGARFWLDLADTAAGAVFLYDGAAAPGAVPLATLFGISQHEHFGESMAGGADADGDGLPDIAVGAPLRSTGALSSNGAVDVFRGGALASGPWTTLTGEASDDWFGQSVAVGDVDGDGRADIIVGAPYNDRAASAAGAVFIYRGGSTPPTSPWRVLVGEAANDQFGWSVAYLGDVDGDGYGDIAVGARLHGLGPLGAAGRVYLFRGGPAMDTIADGAWNGEAKDDWFGNSVAGPGDVDGGGRADVLVGAPYNDRGGSAAGAAYLFRGEDPPGSPPVAIYVGESPNAQLGWSVSGAGDMNGDGHPEVVAGARLQAVGALSAAGRAYVYAGGAALGSVPIATMDGQAANDWFGNSVADVRGFFHAGIGACVVGAPYADTAGGSAAGRACAVGLGGVAAVPRVILPEARLELAPNPAPGPVTLSLSVPAGASMRFEIDDLAGRRVRILEAPPSPGPARVVWDGRDARGASVPAGLYLVRAAGGTETPALTRAARLVVLR